MKDNQNASRRRFFPALLFFACLLPGSLFALDPVVLTDARGEYPLGKHLETLEDKSGKLTIEDVLKLDTAASDAAPDKNAAAAMPNAAPAFRRNVRQAVFFDFTDSTVWVRFQAHNAMDELRHALLEISNPITDSIALYRIKDGRPLLLAVGGDTAPFSNRFAFFHYHVYRLSLPARGTEQFYVRFRSESSLVFTMSLWAREAFERKAHAETTLIGISYGIIIIMIVYNLFLLFSLRELAYAYYVLYAVGSLLLQLYLNGLYFMYVFEAFPFYYQYGAALFGLFGAFWIVLFTRRFLNTGKNAPFLDKALLVFAAVTVGLLAFVLAFRPRFSEMINLFTGPVLIVLVMTAGIRVVLAGYRPARFFLLALSLLCGGIIAFLLMIYGVIPYNPVSQYGINIGTVLELTFLSLALADRINVLKAEKEQADRARIREQRKALARQSRLNVAFARFVPSQFLEYLGKQSILDIRLGDAVEREMTILFSDIRDFTSISENMTAAENFRFVNGYLKRTGPIIRAHNGFIDKFIGDAIMALFPEKADDGVRSAIQVLDQVKTYNVRRLAKGFPAIRIGIGIHTGQLMLGTVGEMERMEGTVISDAVNLASRIEGLTKTYGASILISESTLGKLADPLSYACRFLDRVKVKGKQDSVGVYEVFEGDPDEVKELKSSTRADFEEGIRLFHAGHFADASARFAAVLALNPDDAPAALYRHRCDENA